VNPSCRHRAVGLYGPTARARAGGGADRRKNYRATELQRR
jgi:hypothetical protein